MSIRKYIIIPSNVDNFLVSLLIVHSLLFRVNLAMVLFSERIKCVKMKKLFQLKSPNDAIEPE